jgi:hypothetical protein
MKKILLLLLGFPMLSFAQGISVSDDYSNTELVNNILIGSSCIEAGNIQSQGDCGIAYFSTTNSDFAFQEGIIIRSGIAMMTEGGYSGNNQSSTCSGITDVDLQGIVSDYGMSGSISDVSFLEFDFIASADYFSFEFIFASNEYGTYQCSFGDTFAFILTDLTTGVKQNLAVIPGTNIPVSVVTIHDGAYNSGCPSQNVEFFEQMNTFGDPLNMKGHTVPMVASADITPNHPYSIKLAIGDYADTILDSAVFLKAGSFTIGCSADKIKMVSFLDQNQNGTQDDGEPEFTLGNYVHQLNGGEPSQLFSQDGAAYVYALDHEDTHTFSFEISSEYAEYYTSSVTYENVVVEADSGENVYYFPVVNTASYSDVSIDVISGGSGVSGASQTNTLVYRNMGTAPASGTITFMYSGNVSISAVSETITTTLDNGFTLDYSNLQPFETQVVTVTYDIPMMPPAPSAQENVITTSVSITSDASQETSEANNSFELISYITDSYIPNEVVEAHGNQIEIDDFSQDDYLYYTIRFQNPGTTSTSFIRVINNLPATLDETTFQMIHSSHSYNLTRTGSELNWFFENTTLVPETDDFGGSQGYISFKIKPKAGYGVGTIIENDAHIFIDYNPAILTEVFVTEFIQTTMQTDIPEDNLKLSVYPNPTKETINIAIANFSEPVNYTITDITGKTVMSGTFHQAENTVSLGGLTLGLYFVKVTSGYFTELVKVIKN